MLSQWGLILILAIATHSSYAAEEKISLLDKAIEDEITVDALYDKSWDIISDFPDSAIYYADLQKHIAEKIDYKLGIINALYVKGNAYNKMYHFDLAAKEFYRVLSLIKENSNEKFLKKKAQTLQGLGRSYEMTFNYDMASDLYQEGLSIALLINYERGIADLNYNLGVCYREKNNPDKAIEHYNKALKIYQKNNKYDDIADVYNIIGILYKREKNYDLAKEYFKKAVTIVEEHNTLIQKKSWYISNIGENYFVQEQYEIAKLYYDQALQLSIELNDTKKIKWLYNNLGDVLLKEGNYSEAIVYYQKSMSLEKEKEENINDELKRAYKGISIAYDSIGNYQLASLYKSKFMAQTELLAETKDKLQEQNAQYRMREVEWQMERLAQNEQIQFYKTSVFWFRISISLIVVVLFMISYFTYKYYRKIALAKRLLNY